MANEPGDDIFKNLAKAMEELLSNLQIDDSARFVGCTIISGPGDDPRIFQMDESACDKVRYEVVEGDGTVFITAEVPPEATGSPDVEIRTDSVCISVDGRKEEIPLEFTLDVKNSHYAVKNGLIDVVCRKSLD